MKCLINGIVYDSTKVSISVKFDENEQAMFNGMKWFVSAPEHYTKDETQALMDTLTQMTVISNPVCKKCGCWYPVEYSKHMNYCNECYTQILQEEHKKNANTR
jgi:hypothetical protein